MPGFSISYHAHVLGVSRHRIEQHIGGYDDLKDAVADNWMSATREDCVRLAQLRPGSGNVPLISQIKAVEDLKRMRLVDVASDYGVKVQAIMGWRRVGFRTYGQLPAGFEHLVKPT